MLFAPHKLEPYDSHPLVHMPPRPANTSLLHGRHALDLAKLMKHDEQEYPAPGSAGDGASDSSNSSREVGVTAAAVSGSLASRIAARRRKRHLGTLSATSSVSSSERHQHGEASKHLYIGALIGAALDEA